MPKNSNSGQKQLDKLLQSNETQDVDIEDPSFSSQSQRSLEESRAKRFGTTTNLNENAGKQAKVGDGRGNGGNRGACAGNNQTNSDAGSTRKSKVKPNKGEY